MNDNAEGNVIAGNRRHGVRIQQGAAGDQTSNNTVRGNMVGNGASTQFQTGSEIATFAATSGFNRQIGPVELRADDVTILATNGANAEVLAVRYIGKSLYQVDFRPTGYGTYLLSIGPQVPDRDGRPMDQDGDGISAYRSGAEQRDTFVAAVTVHAPGNAPRDLPRSEPAQPAVGIDANGDPRLSQAQSRALVDMTMRRCTIC
jgi:hypothetical protein